MARPGAGRDAETRLADRHPRALQCGTRREPHASEQAIDHRLHVGVHAAVARDGVLPGGDAPRAESRSFVSHLGPKHHFASVMLVSGDRESEVRYLAEQVGITEIHAQQNPEQKLALVRAETAKAKTLYVGAGINDFADP